MRYLLVILTFFIFSCQSDSDQIPTIPVVAGVTIHTDGEPGDWSAVSSFFETEDFKSPWDDSPYGKTRFRAVADRDTLYFCFEAADSTPITQPFTRELDVADGDRVEIFLSPDSTMASYYCFELGPTGDNLDYHGQFYRNFDDRWNLEGLRTATRQTPSGYVVEGVIPMAFLKKLSPGNEGYLTFYMGLYRAEYRKPFTEENPVQWICWVDPQTPEPDFHVPASLRPVQIALFE